MLIMFTNKPLEEAAGRAAFAFIHWLLRTCSDLTVEPAPLSVTSLFSATPWGDMWLFSGELLHMFSSLSCLSAGGCVAGSVQKWRQEAAAPHRGHREQWSGQSPRHWWHRELTDSVWFFFANFSFFQLFITHYLAQNTASNNFYVSGDVLYCKFG